MKPVDYIKLQSKNLLKDYKTRFFNEETKIYEYKPKFFDIGSIFSDYGIPDDKEEFSFTLMNAQHLIAKICGFNNWADLIHSSEPRLEDAKCLLQKFKKIQGDEK